MKFHKDGTQPTQGEIFVFGSNEAGVHGAGAARAAHEHFGARFGVEGAHGLHGRSYAIATKDYNIQTLPMSVIKKNVEKFNEFAKRNQQFQFFLTRVGCVLAGISDKEMAPLFERLPNVSYPENWKEYFI